jgi:hypothetical protein
MDGCYDFACAYVVDTSRHPQFQTKITFAQNQRQSEYQTGKWSTMGSLFSLDDSNTNIATAGN